MCIHNGIRGGACFGCHYCRQLSKITKIVYPAKLKRDGPEVQLLVDLIMCHMPIIEIQKQLYKVLERQL